jgi:hypothetical protein
VQAGRRRQHGPRITNILTLATAIIQNATPLQDAAAMRRAPGSAQRRGDALFGVTSSFAIIAALARVRAFPLARAGSLGGDFLTSPSEGERLAREAFSAALQ